PFDVMEARTWQCGLDADPVRFLQALDRDDLDGNTRRLGLRLLFLGRVVGGRGGCGCSRISSGAHQNSLLARATGEALSLWPALFHRASARVAAHTKY